MLKRDQNENLTSLIVALVVLGTFRFLFPGDTYFINDEPKLVLEALNQNSLRAWTIHGLTGSRGVEYGPFAVWFYQTAFSISHNLYAILIFRIFVVAAATGAGLYFMARLIPTLRSSFGATALLSPYLWFYGRDLWDNSWVIPLSAIAFVSYLGFCKFQKGIFLGLSALAATCAFLTHLMVIPLLAALALHFVFYERSWLFTQWKKFSAIAIICFGISAPYLVHLLSQHPEKAAGAGDLGHFLTPMLGGRFFTALGVEYIVDSGWLYGFTGISRWAWWAVLGVTAVAYPLTWIGIGVAIVELIKNRQKNERSVLSHACFISITALVTQLIVSYSYRLIPVPYIHNSLWLFYFFFLWLAVSKLTARHYRYLLPAYSGALALALTVLIVSVHLRGGNREEHYGPTLANQLQIVKEIRKYPEGTPLKISARYAKDFPWALDALLKLSPPPLNASLSAHALSIQYQKPLNAQNGRIILLAETQKPKN